MIKVYLTYFKRNGTYYNTTAYNTNLSTQFDILDEVRIMGRNNELPVLLDKDVKINILVEVENMMPHIIMWDEIKIMTL